MNELFLALCFHFLLFFNSSLVNLRLLALGDVIPLCSHEAPKTEQQQISILSPVPWSQEDVMEEHGGSGGWLQLHGSVL